MRDDTLLIPITPLTRCATLSRLQPKLVGHPGKALARDATRILRFVIHAAGCLHSMVLHGRRCCCCYRRRLRIILKSARTASGRRTSLTIVCQRSPWCRSSTSARHRSHICSADSTSSPHNRQTASSETLTEYCQR